MNRSEELETVARKSAGRTKVPSGRTGAGRQKRETLNHQGTRLAARLRRLFGTLAEVMPPTTITRWLQTPNEGLGGLKPIEVLDRGESRRLRRMIYELHSGATG